MCIILLLVSSVDAPVKRRKRGGGGIAHAADGTLDRSIDLYVYRCYYADCIEPLDPGSLPPPANRPDDAVYWSDPDAWSFAEEGYGGNNGDGTYGLPADDTIIKIPEGNETFCRSN